MESSSIIIYYDPTVNLKVIILKSYIYIKLKNKKVKKK